MEPANNQANPKAAIKFDAVISIAIGILIAAIALVLLLGDFVGIQIARVAPLELAHSTEAIVIQFTEAMNKDSVTDGFTIEPDVEGEFSWNADTLFFQPDEALHLGETYTVTIDAGIESESKRQLLEDYQFTFSIRQPRIAYLAPSNDTPQNIFVASPENLPEATQVTFSTSSIFDFAVSPDGKQIVYAEYEADSPAINLHLLTLETGEIQQITSCENATCTTPVWKPDGTAVAYQRIDADDFLPGGGIGPTYVWVTEFTETSFDNHPIFEDFRLPAYAPQWADNGERIAVFDPNTPGTVVYDFTDGRTYFVPGYNGTMGDLSPDGNQVVYSRRNFDITTESRSYLQLADLRSNESINLTEPDISIVDAEPIWHPNGRDVTFIRRYYDEDSLPGSQLYLLNTDTLNLSPLSDDLRYSNNNFSWDPTGTLLGTQRFAILDEQGQRSASSLTEVWAYNLVSDEWYQVATNAYLPQWIP